MLVWDALICPYCGAEVPLGLMSLVAWCDCGAWYEGTPSNPHRHGWHKELDEVRG
jgi:hypothetical protein